MMTQMNTRIVTDWRRGFPQMISGDPRFDQRLSAFKGQVTLEYFMLFAVVAILTLIGFTSFDQGIRTSLQGFVNAAAAKLAQ